MKSQAGKRLGQAFWEGFIGNYKASGEGLSKKAYCEQQGVSYHTFKRWQARLLQSERQAKPDVFVPLVVKSSSQAMDALSQVFRLTIGSGCFEFPTSIETSELERVLRVLGVVR